MRAVGIGDVAVVACRDELGCWDGWRPTATVMTGHSRMTTWSFLRVSLPLWALHFGGAGGSRRRLIGMHPSPARQE